MEFYAKCKQKIVMSEKVITSVLNYFLFALSPVSGQCAYLSIMQQSQSYLVFVFYQYVFIFCVNFINTYIIK